MALLTSDYIANWYILSDKNNNNYNYIIKDITNTTTQSVEQEFFINAVTAPIAMSVEGVTHDTEINGSAIIQKNPNSKFKDIFDLLIEDFELLRNKLTYPFDYTVQTKNLLESCTVTLGSNVTFRATYKSKFDQIFDINYATAFSKEFDNELLGRVATNYDVRFYNDDRSYKIKSGVISISVQYDKVFLMNTKSVEPYFSPQSYKIDFDLTILATPEDLESFNYNNSLINANYPNFDVNLNNLTLVVGQRSLKLGQASLIDSVKVTMNEKFVEIGLSFKSFARMMS